jgi:hypothetical protein
MTDRTVLAGIAVATLLLTGCVSSAPVAVGNCSVRAVDAHAVAFEANVRSLTHKSIRKVYIIVRTSGRKASGSVIAYEFDGELPTIKWTTRRTIKKVRSDPATLDEHLGSINECYVYAVAFKDGTHWFGGSADM